jgi:hypothetical protein
MFPSYVDFSTSLIHTYIHTCLNILLIASVHLLLNLQPFPWFNNFKHCLTDHGLCHFAEVSIPYNIFPSSTDVHCVKVYKNCKPIWDIKVLFCNFHIIYLLKIGFFFLDCCVVHSHTDSFYVTFATNVTVISSWMAHLLYLNAQSDWLYVFSFKVQACL